LTSFHLSVSDHRSEQWRQELVASLLASGALHSPTLQRAFLTVPREMFVPFFYEEEKTSPTMKWRPISAHETSPEAYLASVYRDQPLITKIDERGMPVSSSSMPSAMAKMLEALDVQPGQRILEIGTGTGYNAALMAMLTGDPHAVVSIENDPVLARNAAQVLKQVSGPGIQVITGDGYAGYARAAPFDGIIATASVSTLPMVWVEQLRVGGRLVMDLQGSLASGFLVLERTQEGASGHFLPEPLYFMPLTTQWIEASRLPSMTHLSQEAHCASFVVASDHAFPENLADACFRWFLQWRIAGCQVSRRKQRQRESKTTISSIFVIDPKTRATVRFRQRLGETTWDGEVYGLPHFWEDLQQVYAEFIALGKPHPHQYHLLIEQQRALLSIGSLHLPL